MNPEKDKITSRAFWDAKYGGRAPRYSLWDPLYGRGGLLARTIGPWLTGVNEVLELGCASSRFLMFFNLAAGLETHGLDYSAPGLRRLEEMAAPHGVRHRLYQGDLFSADLGGRKFDLVFHSGLVEHFLNLDLLFERCRFFCRENGLMIFLMPNMQNLAWSWHGRICPENFKAHYPYTPAEIKAAAEPYFEIEKVRPWGYVQLYAGGPPESRPAAALKYLNLGLMLLTSLAAPVHRGVVGPQLAGHWLFVARART